MLRLRRKSHTQTTKFQPLLDSGQRNKPPAKCQAEQGSGTGLDVKSPKLLRLRRNHLMILPVIAAILLTSCTSTVSSIDTAAASLQPQLTDQQAAAGPIPAPSDKNAAAPAMTNTSPMATQDVAIAAAGGQPGQIIIGAPKQAEAKDFALASAQDSQSDITAAALGSTAGAAKAADGNPAPAAQPQPVIATAQAPASASKLKAPEPNSQQVQLASAAPALTPPVQELTNARPAQQFVDAAPQEPAKKPRKTLFSAMFGDTTQKPATIQAAPAPLPAETQLALAEPAPKKAAVAAAMAEVGTPRLNLVDTSSDTQAAMSVPNVDNGDLPGVRKGALFEIKRRDSLNTDADIDISETDDGPVLLASAGGLARLAPNGLKVQRESVDVACLKPQLVRMLKQIEAHYGRSIVVTSGYRSPGHNRRVRGAKNSLHMYCAAADIEIDGVGKWELAKFARSMSGRGGVGTYCHTEAVHVDIGPNRDWNWRCSRR
jgi:uncharacterized protein YcbK (DUF882 family)